MSDIGRNKTLHSASLRFIIYVCLPFGVVSLLCYLYAKAIVGNDAILKIDSPGVAANSKYGSNSRGNTFNAEIISTKANYELISGVIEHNVDFGEYMMMMVCKSK